MLSIRTQDRMALVPYVGCGVTKYLNNTYDVVMKYENGEIFVLGTYETKVRALEVLDEIQLQNDTNKIYEIFSLDEIDIETFLRPTYEMPKE